MLKQEFPKLMESLYNTIQFGNEEKYQLQQSYASSRPTSKPFCCMGVRLKEIELGGQVMYSGWWILELRREC